MSLHDKVVMHTISSLQQIINNNLHESSSVIKKGSINSADSFPGLGCSNGDQ